VNDPVCFTQVGRELVKEGLCVDQKNGESRIRKRIRGFNKRYFEIRTLELFVAEPE
jgi:hypothetical protein